jgi:protein-disulfide isomerase
MSLRLLKVQHLLSIPLAFVFLTNCTTEKNAATSAGGIVRPLADDVVVLEYKGGKITAKEINANLKRDLTRMSEEAIEAYQQFARQIVVQKLVEAEAKGKGVSVEQYMTQLPDMEPASDAEIDAFFKMQPDLQKGVKDPRTGKIQKVSRDDVGRFLSAQKQRGAQQKLVEDLMAKAEIKMKLEAPAADPIKVASSAKPAVYGPANAKVVIHEFSSFQCGFCARVQGTVSQIKETYKDSVRFEFRHFPLDTQPESLPAAIATVCANEQGKFWELHDKIFANQREMNAANFTAWAKELGLDMDKFKKCQDNPESKNLVMADMEIGRNAGVDSTPAFIINGVMVKGAQPFEKFKSIIDAQLAKK